LRAKENKDPGAHRDQQVHQVRLAHKDQQDQQVHRDLEDKE
jgi:hypothetical protein